MIENPGLVTYWLTFPADANAPVGIGVTARSLADAFDLASRCSLGTWLAQAREVRVVSGVRIADMDAGHVIPNSGPMQLRGVWFPAENLGFGGHGNPEYVRLIDTGH